MLVPLTMKQCPQCGQTFEDGLAFCQRDGAPLRAAAPPPIPPPATGYGAPPTGYGPPPGGYGPAPGAPPPYAPPAYAAPPRKGFTPTQALLGGGMLLLAGGGAAYFFLRGNATPKTATAAPAADTTAAVAAQAPAYDAASGASSSTTGASIGTRYADSPRDGFVALRSTPSTTSGTRLLQIPHGEEVEVLHENGPAGRVSGRDGRWIQVRYRGTVGWAFSGFLASPHSGLADGQVPINQYGVINQPIAGYLNLRAGPTVRHAILSRMYTGERVLVVACNQRVERGTSGRMGRWCRLTHGSVDGWAFDAFIDGIGPDG